MRMILRRHGEVVEPDASRSGVLQKFFLKVDHRIRAVHFAGGGGEHIEIGK